MSQLKSFPCAKGHCFPLGVSKQENGLNFCLFSEHAIQVTLCLYNSDGPELFAEIPFNPKVNRTGYIWHILVKDLPTTELAYGYRISGPTDDPKMHYNPKLVLSDPYARALHTSNEWGRGVLNSDQSAPLGRVVLESPFDWEDDSPPNIPTKDLVIYEMHVRSFTQHPSSKVKSPGTFLGIMEKIPYLKKMGINAIELMPIFEFNECEIDVKNPKTQEPLKNVWGYSTINFFAPMNRFSAASAWAGAIDEFRTLVKELHKNQIEVILDVVYNHTAEGGTKGPCFSFRGIDNSIYYMLSPNGDYMNFSGTGNTFNCNHPVVAQLIVDSLRYWVAEMHVDGFRFDLASILTRSENGTPLPSPYVVDAITNDPILANIKLIAEAWDAGGLYQVGNFPGQGQWSEWNGKFRDTVRKFIKGTDDLSGEFAWVMCGSQHIYGHDRRPYHSINFVTAHDGYTLKDLVSYQDKHNEENGEENRDGANDNESWNCGAEGPTDDEKIRKLRDRQLRNFHTALLLAIGTPMLLMGDEYGHTRNGNNNTWCQDNELNWFLWDELEKNKEFKRFYDLLIQFRHQTPILKRSEFLTDKEVAWHGLIPLKPNWGKENRFIAYTLKNPKAKEYIYIAFNSYFNPVKITLPTPPQGKKWYRVIDTSLPSPQDFSEDPKSTPMPHTYEMKDHSAVVVKAF
ncbi:MAG: glycogen debranching protein GlgX [Parachlamydiales bacterium]